MADTAGDGQSLEARGVRKGEPAPAELLAEILKEDPDKRDKARLLLARLEYSSTYQGPLPPPWVLAEYDKILPGCAERMIARFEKQSDHRMHLEKFTIEGDGRRSNWGMVCGTIVALAFLASGVLLVMNGHDVAGGAIATVDIAAILAAYLVGTHNRTQERLKKQQMVIDQERSQGQEEK